MLVKFVVQQVSNEKLTYLPWSGGTAAVAGALFSMQHVWNLQAPIFWVQTRHGILRVERSGTDWTSVGSCQKNPGCWGTVELFFAIWLWNAFSSESKGPCAAASSTARGGSSPFKIWWMKVMLQLSMNVRSWNSMNTWRKQRRSSGRRAGWEGNL